MNNNDEIIIPTHILQLVTPQQAWNYSILPKEESGNTICLYVDEGKASYETQNELELIFGKKVDFVELPAAVLHKTLGKYYRKGKTGSVLSGPAADINDENFLFQLLSEAYSVGCSDIHIEAFEERCRIRMRIDGKLLERYIINKNDYQLFVNKIKIKANLDISEKRLPQDGRIFYENNEVRFDIRVSSLPSMYGEKIVLRLLSKETTNIDIEKLGFQKNQAEDYLEGIKRPHGIVLISGPTGSGKTTTLYATLKLLNRKDVNILTVEDPIEYTLEGVTQVQLKESIGLSFASALKTFLRQDPDIIMLGEIRDGETAQMAIRAALTGHLVLSTIHTNSAWGTVSRLIDMGVPPFLISSTLNLTVAQRLLRLLCNNCKREETFDIHLLPRKYKGGSKIATHYVPVGCEDCHFTGYKGRKALYEVIPVDAELSEKIKENDQLSFDFMHEKKLKTLSDVAMEDFLAGITSMEEIYPILINSI